MTKTFLIGFTIAALFSSVGLNIALLSGWLVKPSNAISLVGLE